VVVAIRPKAASQLIKNPMDVPPFPIKLGIGFVLIGAEKCHAPLKRFFEALR
jgi:hypothetical protein